VEKKQREFGILLDSAKTGRRPIRRSIADQSRIAIRRERGMCLFMAAPHKTHCLLAYRRWRGVK